MDYDVPLRIYAGRLPVHRGCFRLVRNSGIGNYQQISGELNMDKFDTSKQERTLASFEEILTDYEYSNDFEPDVVGMIRSAKLSVRAIIDRLQKK